jgi:hypothetical protein
VEQLYNIYLQVQDEKGNLENMIERMAVGKQNNCPAIY